MTDHNYRMGDDSVTTEAANGARLVGKSVTRRGEDVIKAEREPDRSDAGSSGAGGRRRRERAGARSATSVNPQNPIDSRMVYLPPA